MGKCIGKNNIILFYIAIGCILVPIVVAAGIMILTVGPPKM